MVILADVKTSLGILEDNLGFDSELLMFINSAKTALVQLGLAEFDIDIVEATEWPTFPNSSIDSLSKHYIHVKVRETFDPSASETISRAMLAAASEVEGRVAHEISEVLDVAG